ncbi:GNAT family N-acetyltransferase [Nocardiopsis sp. CC223A]|uniref:GNAT family N-acetyltransferase n=1 Tax=Nocardiopsis sp. CC223A TaxID=3044051 RepID=UPI00278C5072|nr:GNAT family N-acetyltransferase [Nocardiopsis sp. CC223A]
MRDLAERAMERWAAVAGPHGTPIPLTPPLTVAAVEGSGLCPNGWCGIVRLGEATLATAPGTGDADALRAALATLAPKDRTDPGAVDRALERTGALAVAEVLGPASLAYVDAAALREADDEDVPVVTIDPGDARLAALLHRAGPEDAGESGLADMDAPVSAVEEDGRVVAAAGYARLSADTAHLGVLTDPERRDRGLARFVASAATARALGESLLPQWRARPPRSRAVAAGLGHRALGAQLSVRLHPRRR